MTAFVGSHHSIFLSALACSSRVLLVPSGSAAPLSNQVSCPLFYATMIGDWFYYLLVFSVGCCAAGGLLKCVPRPGFVLDR